MSIHPFGGPVPSCSFPAWHWLRSLSRRPAGPGTAQCPLPHCHPRVFPGKEHFPFLWEGRKADAQPGLELLFSLTSFPLGTNGIEVILCTPQPQFLLSREGTADGIWGSTCGSESRLGSQGGASKLKWFLQSWEKRDGLSRFKPGSLPGVAEHSRCLCYFTHLNWLQGSSLLYLPWKLNWENWKLYWKKWKHCKFTILLLIPEKSSAVLPLHIRAVILYLG